MFVWATKEIPQYDKYVFISPRGRMGLTLKTKSHRKKKILHHPRRLGLQKNSLLVHVIEKVVPRHQVHFQHLQDSLRLRQGVEEHETEG